MDLSQADPVPGTPPSTPDAANPGADGAAPDNSGADATGGDDGAGDESKPDSKAKKPAKAAAKAPASKSEKPAAKSEPASDDADDDDDAVHELLRDDGDGEEDGDDDEDADADADAADEDADEDADAALEEAAKEVKQGKKKPEGAGKGKDEKKPAKASDTDDDEPTDSEDDEDLDDEDLDDVEVDGDGRTSAEKRDADAAKQLPEPLRPVYAQVQREARELVNQGMDVLGIAKGDKKGVKFLTTLVKTMADQVVIAEANRLELDELRNAVQGERLWAKADPDIDRIAEEVGAEELVGMSSKQLTRDQRQARLEILREAGELRARANAKLKDTGKQLDALTVLRKVVRDRLATSGGKSGGGKQANAAAIKRKLGGAAPADGRKARSLDDILREARRD
jgi:hypothetical protein